MNRKDGERLEQSATETGESTEEKLLVAMKSIDKSLGLLVRIFMHSAGRATKPPYQTELEKETNKGEKGNELLQ